MGWAVAVLHPLPAAVLSTWHRVHDTAPCWMLPSRGTWGPPCWEDSPLDGWLWRAQGLPPPVWLLGREWARLLRWWHKVCALSPSQSCRDLGLGAAPHPPFPRGGGMECSLQSPSYWDQLPCATSTTTVNWLRLVGNKIRLFSIIFRGLRGGGVASPACPHPVSESHPGQQGWEMP